MATGLAPEKDRGHFIPALGEEKCPQSLRHPGVWMDAERCRLAARRQVATAVAVDIARVAVIEARVAVVEARVAIAANAEVAAIDVTVAIAVEDVAPIITPHVAAIDVTIAIAIEHVAPIITPHITTVDVTIAIAVEGSVAAPDATVIGHIRVDVIGFAQPLVNADAGVVDLVALLGGHGLLVLGVDARLLGGQPGTFGLEFGLVRAQFTLLQPDAVAVGLLADLGGARPILHKLFFLAAAGIAGHHDDDGDDRNDRHRDKGNHPDGQVVHRFPLRNGKLSVSTTPQLITFQARFTTPAAVGNGRGTVSVGRAWKC